MGFTKHFGKSFLTETEPRSAMRAIYWVLFCTLWLSARADECLVYNGNYGQYWLVCSSQGRSGAISQCNLRQTKFATTDDDPSLPLVNVLDQLKYLASPLSQVQEYYNMFATSYSYLLNQRLTYFDQLADYVISEYEQASADMISYFNSFSVGRTGGELTNLQSLNATMQTRLGTERTKILNAISQYKLDAASVMTSTMNGLEASCSSSRTSVSSAASSGQLSGAVNQYETALDHSLIQVNNDQISVDNAYLGFTNLIIAASNNFNSDANSITSTYSSFTSLKTQVQSRFTSLKNNLTAEKNAVNSLVQAATSYVKDRLQQATNQINKDFTKL